MNALTMVRENLHEVSVGAGRVLLHVPTSSLYEIDGLGGDVLDLFRELDEVTEADVRRRFDGTAAPGEVVDTLQELLQLDLLRPAGTPRRRVAPPEISDHPLSTIVLNVQTGCNLGCTYCYREDLRPAARGAAMPVDVARAGIDLLFEEGGERERLNVVFFGGEPLSNMPLIRAAVDHAERRAAEEGRKVGFSLTTNATLLSDAIIDYLDAHGFSLAVSIDGPPEQHDRNRITVGGKGTYAVVEAKARHLLARYRSGPVGARVTLAHGNTDVVAIHEHLSALGFSEIGFAPVTSHESAALALDDDELAEVYRGLRVLADRYVAAAKRGEHFGFTNLSNLLADLHHGHRRLVPCGAGLGMLSVDHEGSLDLCHRFTGSSQPRYGDVDRGIDRAGLARFLKRATERSGTPCEACRIRNLCSGGCYHEAYIASGDPLAPTSRHCELLRGWIDYAIGAYAEIRAHDNDYLENHLGSTRRA